MLFCFVVFVCVATGIIAYQLGREELKREIKETYILTEKDHKQQLDGVLLELLGDYARCLGEPVSAETQMAAWVKYKLEHDMPLSSEELDWQIKQEYAEQLKRDQQREEEKRYAEWEKKEGETWKENWGCACQEPQQPRGESHTEAYMRHDTT